MQGPQRLSGDSKWMLSERPQTRELDESHQTPRNSDIYTLVKPSRLGPFGVLLRSAIRKNHSFQVMINNLRPPSCAGVPCSIL